MKRNVFTFVLVLIYSFASLFGCNHSTNRTNSLNQSFSFEMLNSLEKVYVGESDAPLYETLDSFSQAIIQGKKAKCALVLFHCVEVTPYITISHHGDDIIVSGKTIAKCIIDEVAESYNDFKLSEKTSVEIEQKYYFEPASEEECIKMFEEFGAQFQSNELGELIGMDINDGDYVLTLKTNVDYLLKIHKDVLPLMLEQYYTGLLLIENGKDRIVFISPKDELEMYNSFLISDNYLTIANEIKHILSK